MTDTPTDVEHLLTWVGQQDEAEDVLTAALVEKFQATFNLPPAREDREPAPMLIHFCLAQNVPATSRLAADGHPQDGGFLPPVPLPRRMWAAGKIAFHNDLFVGDRIRRISKIAQVEVKGGRTRSCAVTVQHTLLANGRDAISEEQVIVYGAPDAAPALPPAPRGTALVSFAVNEPMLFRYAALTFNAHRIHYDRAYATVVEGYPGLVIPGRLQATLLLNFARQLLETPVRTFSFRDVTPLIEDGRIGIHAAQEGDVLKLWTAANGGPQAMVAEAG